MIIIKQNITLINTMSMFGNMNKYLNQMKYKYLNKKQILNNYIKNMMILFKFIILHFSWKTKNSIYNINHIFVGPVQEVVKPNHTLK